MEMNQAIKVLEDSVLHVGNQTFGLEKKQRAVQLAGYRFCRATGCSYGRDTVSLADGDATVDITGTTALAEFYESTWLRGDINGYPVRKVPYEHVQQITQDATVEGRPSLIGFDTKAYGKFDLECDKAYTLTVTWRKPLLDINSGALTLATLNIPEEWVWDVIWWGGRAALLNGVPGHPDDMAAQDTFDELIANAKTYFAISNSGVRDRNVPEAA